MNRKWLGLFAGLAILLLAGVSPPTKAPKEVRIGFLAPLTGFWAQLGKEMQSGIKMYMEEIGYKMGPLKVKFIVEDTAAKPANNVRKAVKLIQRDKVHVLTGAMMASSGYALAPVADRHRIPYVAAVPSADDLTQRKRYKYFLRARSTSSQDTHPLAAWAFDQGYRRVVALAFDYAFGYEQVGGFQKVFEDMGGKIISKIWVKLGAKDYGPYLPQIKRDADAVLVILGGPMTLAFTKQYRAAGIKLPLLGGPSTADEFILQTMGDDAVGYVTASPYSAALETPQNISFVKRYIKKYGKIPSYFSETSYTSAKLIHKALEKTGWRPDKSELFLAMFKTVRIIAPRGPIYLDKYGNAVQNTYIRQVKRIAGDRLGLGAKPGSLWNIVIKTYPALSQFWTYGAEEFLKQPVYSRKFPPCRFCE